MTCLEKCCMLALGCIPALILLMSAGGGDSWIERDRQGRVRLRGGFDAQDAYSLQLLDAQGAVSLDLRVDAEGGASILLSQGDRGLRLQQKSSSSLVVAYAGSKVIAGLQTEKDVASFIIGEEGGKGVSMLSGPGGSTLKLASKADGHESVLSLSARPSAAEFSAEVDGRKGIQIADGPGLSGMILGEEGSGGEIRLMAAKGGDASIILADSSGLPRLGLQHSGSSGAAGLLLMDDAGKERARIGLDGSGKAVATISDGSGKAQSLVESREAGR